MGHEQCKISVKYVMCSRLEAYLRASGQNHFVSKTKTPSSFQRFNKYVLFIIKMNDTNRAGELWLIFRKIIRVFVFDRSVTKGVI